MAVEVRGSRSRAGRAIVTALVVWAFLSSGATSVAWGLSGDVAGGTTTGSVSVINEFDLTKVSNPRSCLAVVPCTATSHLRPTCLERTKSCEALATGALPSFCTKCVVNRSLAAVVSAREPAGTYLTPGGGAATAALLGHAMGRVEVALVQAYSVPAGSSSRGTLVFQEIVFPPTLGANALFTLAVSAGRQADMVTPAGGFVVVKVTVDQDPLTSLGAFDEKLALAPLLDSVTAAGPLGCEPVEADAIVRVTLTQPDNPAVARGEWRGACDADDRWATTVRPGSDDAGSCLRGARRLLPTVRGPLAATFAPGPAQACAIAEYRRDGRVIRSRQWCSPVELVLE